MQISTSAQTEAALFTTSQDEIHRWRLQLLNGLLLAIFIAIAPLIVVASYNFLQNQPQSAGVVIGGFAIGYLIGGIITFGRQIPYLVRTGIILAILYVVGIHNVFTFGLISDGRLHLLITVVLATLLVGVRTAIALAVLIIVALAGIGWGIHGWRPAVHMEPDLINWATNLVSLALHMTIVLVSISFLLRRLTDALGISRIALQQAEASAQEAGKQATVLLDQTRRLEDTEQRLRSLVTTLEIPTVDLADQVVLAPIVGTVDNTRARTITDRLLQTAHARRIRLVILDIAGMPTADVASIQSLQNTAAALKLLGCRVVFTGFSPEVALNFQQTGSMLGVIEVRRSPQEVLSLFHDYGSANMGMEFTER